MVVAKRICIAAALIDDGYGYVFLVRKRGTITFMQAGGKIRAGETPFQALARELTEELHFTPSEEDVHFLGTFTCAAANEPGYQLDAHLFHIRAGNHAFAVAAELEEALWVCAAAADHLSLAPFTRDHVLPLARAISAQRPI